MKLAIYRKNDEITKIHTIKDDFPDIENAVESFNRKSEDTVVSVEEFDSKSVVAHLYNRNKDRIDDFKGELNGISGDIYYLDRTLDHLMRKLEEMEVD